MAEQEVYQEPLMERLVKFFSTFFYVGMIPFAPGTMGSIAGLLIFKRKKRTCSLRGFIRAYRRARFFFSRTR